jgi:hypothetical protein
MHSKTETDFEMHSKTETDFEMHSKTETDFEMHLKTNPDFEMHLKTIPIFFITIHKVSHVILYYIYIYIYIYTHTHTHVCMAKKFPKVFVRHVCVSIGMHVYKKACMCICSMNVHIATCKIIEAQKPLKNGFGYDFWYQFTNRKPYKTETDNKLCNSLLTENRRKTETDHKSITGLTWVAVAPRRELTGVGCCAIRPSAAPFSCP